MPQYRLYYFGESVLHQRGEEVGSFDEHLTAFSQGLIKAMDAARSHGLAAHQVGRAMRVFVLDLKDHADETSSTLVGGKTLSPFRLFPLVAVNPKLEYLPGDTVQLEESCASLPGVRVQVPRAYAVRLHYHDLNGRARVLEGYGLMARAIQHLYDHMEGVLITNRLDPSALRDMEPQLTRLKRLARSTRPHIVPAAAATRAAVF